MKTRAESFIPATCAGISLFLCVLCFSLCFQRGVFPRLCLGRWSRQTWDLRQVRCERRRRRRGGYMVVKVKAPSVLRVCRKPKSECAHRWPPPPPSPPLSPPPHLPMPWGAQDGRLAAGDQLLSVDGRSLVGLSQERYYLFV